MKAILKKLITMIITLFIVSFLVFLAFSVIPGDPALSKLGTQATPEALEALREEMGLNAPFFTRYFTWIGSFFTGDMGTSYSYGIPVSELIMDKLPITLVLTGIALVIMMVFTVLLGIYAARHEGGIIDRILMVVNQIIMAVPAFFAGIIICFLFGLILKWFTPGAFVSYEKDFSGFVAYLIAPAVAIALPKCAMASKLLRSSLIEQGNMDYIRTAYSRGNTTKGVLYRHALRNAMIPVVTFWAMAYTDMIAGSVVIEQVFGIPVIGRILLTGISNRDYPVVMAIICLLALFIIVANTLVDLIYKWIDPRMRDNG